MGKWISVKSKQVRVFHPESPGVYVTVKRNFIQRVLYPKDFATLGEVMALPRYGISRKEERTQEAIKRVLHAKRSSKAAKTAKGSALTQR